MKSTPHVGQMSARERGGERVPEPGLTRSPNPPYAEERSHPGQDDASQCAERVRIRRDALDHGRAPHVSTPRVVLGGRTDDDCVRARCAGPENQSRGREGRSAALRRWTCPASRKRCVSRHATHRAIRRDRGLDVTILPASATPAGAAGSGTCSISLSRNRNHLHTMCRRTNLLYGRARSLFRIRPWVQKTSRSQEVVPDHLLSQYTPAGQRTLRRALRAHR